VVPETVMETVAPFQQLTAWAKASLTGTAKAVIAATKSDTRSDAELDVRIVQLPCWDLAPADRPENGTTLPVDQGIRRSLFDQYDA
jgi:hypothetical protein